MTHGLFLLVAPPEVAVEKQMEALEAPQTSTAPKTSTTCSPLSKETSKEKASVGEARATTPVR